MCCSFLILVSKGILIDSDELLFELSGKPTNIGGTLVTIKTSSLKNFNVSINPSPKSGVSNLTSASPIATKYKLGFLLALTKLAMYASLCSLEAAFNMCNALGGKCLNNACK